MERLISVIVTIYNDERYLRECLDSVAGQTWNNLEIILVDDGSTDQSVKIAEEFRKRDSRIRMVCQANGGASAARNAGLSCAHGDYIGFVDGDDVLAPQMYERLLTGCEQEGAGAAVCNIICFTDGTRPKPDGGYIRTNYCTQERSVIFSNALNDSQSVCNKLFRAELFYNIRFPLGRLSEDGYVCYDLLYRAKKVYYCSINGYFYRRRKGSLTTSAFVPADRDLIVSNVRTYCRVKRIVPQLWEDGLNRVINSGFLNVMEKLGKINFGSFFKIHGSIRVMRSALIHILKDLFRSQKINTALKIQVAGFVISPFLFYMYTRVFHGLPK